jgi:hypothetical protein
LPEDFVKQENATHAGPLPDPWSLAGNIIQVNVEATVTRDQLHEALDQVLTLSGCAGCGLLGFDVHLLGGDPITSQLQAIQGIKSVRLVSRQG